MFEKIKSTLRRWGVKLGILEELHSLEEHKEILIDEEAYKRIARNKEIYSGTVEEWHLNVPVLYSNLEMGTRNMLTMGMGKVLAQKMAGLIFNEKTNISFDDEKAEGFVMGVLNNNGFFEHFQRYLEYGIALSGMAIKVYEHEGKIKLAYAAADAFYPLGNDSENVDEALFVSKEYQDGKYYTLLEWNEWENGVYVVRNELYESDDPDRIGTKTSLNKIYEGMEKKVGLPTLRRPLFTYFKLNTANNKNLTSPLGVSIYENSYDTLYMLDFMYDFWHNEFDLGRRRIAVPKRMVRPFTGPDGSQKVAFDPKETVFVQMDMDDNSQPIDMHVELRAKDIIESINALLDILSMQTGLSAGTFTFDGKSVKTATEVVSENSMTFQTKNSHETLVEAGIKNMITTIIDMGKLYELYDGPEEFEVKIDFDDSIAQDRDQNLAYYTLAANAGFIPKLEAIQRVFKVTEEEAQKWLDAVVEEKKRMTPEFESFLGLE